MSCQLLRWLAQFFGLSNLSNAHMPTVKLSPLWSSQQFFDNQGRVLAGGLIDTFEAGTSTPLATYTDDTGSVPNSNPIELDTSSGRSPEIWLIEGSSYDFFLTDSLANPLAEAHGVTGLNDIATAQVTDYVTSGLTPTFVSSTQFTVVGDYRTTFTVNRRVRIACTAGTKYGYVSAVSFSSPNTTVTVVMDDGSSISGITAADYSILDAANNTAVPMTISHTLNISQHGFIGTNSAARSTTGDFDTFFQGLDVGDIFNPTTGVATIARAGTYLVLFTVFVSATSGGSIAVNLEMNGSSVTGAVVSKNNVATADGVTALACSRALTLSAGDTLNMTGSLSGSSPSAQVVYFCAFMIS